MGNSFGDDEDSDLNFELQFDNILDRGNRTLFQSSAAGGYRLASSSKSATEDFEILFEAKKYRAKQVAKQVTIEVTPKNNYFLLATVDGTKIPPKHLGSRLKDKKLMELVAQVVEDFDLEVEVAANLYLELPETSTKKMFNFFLGDFELACSRKLKIGLGRELVRNSKRFYDLHALFTNSTLGSRAVWLEKLKDFMSQSN